MAASTSSTVDNSEAASRRRVTLSQLDVLWEFLNSNRDVALGHNKAAQAREYVWRKWSGAAANLNAQGEGAVKDWKGWAKYWVDYKAKLKKRASDVRASQNQTGGGPSEVPPLNEIEQKFILITGQDFGLGMPGIRVEPFEDTSSPRVVVEELSIPEASAHQIVESLAEDHNLHLDDPLAMVADVGEQVQQPLAGAERRRRVHRRPVATDADSGADVGEPIEGEMPAPVPEQVQHPLAGAERRRRVHRRPVATDADSGADVGEPIEGEMPAPVPEQVQHPLAGAERRRRVRRRYDPLTQEAARQAVVDSSRIRAEAVTSVVAVLERIASSIDSIGSILVRIEEKLPVAARDERPESDA